MGRSGIKATTGLLLLTLCLGGANVAHSYPGATHQQLMFLAARQYNECVKAEPAQRLSALQVRYAARAAVSQAEANFVRRMFRWGFYERERQKPKSSMWVVETRMHEHFNALVAQGEEAVTDAELFSIAGRIAAYVQDVSSPVRVVPIYTARFWRFNTNDRFDNFKLQEEQVAASLADVCATVLTDTPLEYSSILKATADESLAAIVEPIPGLPTTWQSFWRLASEPSDFGEYGIAGNRFGARTSFRCGEERCVLLSKDPLYEEFAQARHVDAVIGTMRVLHSLQLRRLAREQGATPATEQPTPNQASFEKEALDIEAQSEAAREDGTEANEAEAVLGDEQADQDAASSMVRAQIRNLTANE